MFAHVIRIACIAMFPVACMFGCDSKSEPPKKNGGQTAVAQASLAPGFFLTAAPAGAKWVEDIKKTAKAGETITIRGVVGGSKEPFVEGRAVLTLMGQGLKPCGKDSPMPECPTPWDFCCDPKQEIVAHSATIQVVDASGAPLRLSLKGQNQLKELSDLVVVGKVRQADGKMLLVDATNVYIHR